MSKRALKNYLSGHAKPQLEAQILDLYQRFRKVKTYCNFTFSPGKLITAAKFKMGKEYFPMGRVSPAWG